MELLKLNLGCGTKLMPGYVNVDKYGSPDRVHDLEVFPWPWDTSSVGEVVMSHVLEHLGQNADQFLGIMKELYRVCAPGAVVRIAVPHPRSDDFMNDPTHVRVVTPEVLALFSKRKNREWAAQDGANSPLGLFLDVDFEMENCEFHLDDWWSGQLQSGQITEQDVGAAVRRHNNVIKEIRMLLKVVKPTPAGSAR